MEDDSEAQMTTDDGDQNQEEEELMAQNILSAMEEAWLNEKFAPEILPYQFNLVDCILQQVTHMEENLKRLEKGDLRLMIHRMELDRIKFIISSYLRTRLEKIEQYTSHILSHAHSSLDMPYLTAAELQYAKDFLLSIKTLFQRSALKKMPGPFQTFEVNKLTIKPNMQAFVLLRVNNRVNGVVIPGLMDEEVDLEQGSQYIIQYNAVADLVKSGAVQLI